MHVFLALLLSAVGSLTPIITRHDVRVSPYQQGIRTTMSRDTATAAQPVYEFRNGRWFDGTGFTERTFYTQYGTLSGMRPARVDSVIDLDGSWVVPPYGEAHNHNVEASARLAPLIRRYLESGVFYVKNPNVLPSSVLEIRDRVNMPASIDVSFALGGFTSPGGHPVSVVQRNIERGIWSEADGEGAFYHEIADERDLDRKWAGFLGYDPDFVKGYLLYSEEFEARARDSAHVGRRGLDPALLQELTRRAHAAGLRVSVHVETAHDFRNALNAGVDEINHLPGFRGNEENRFPDLAPFRLREEDAMRAAEQGIVVVTTLGDFDEFADASTARRARELFRHNLNVLQEHGVSLAVGSDDYGSVGVGEALQLLDLGVFSNLELLEMWVEDTPRTIFPFRLIGSLEPGYEANFLVLDRNPLEDFTATQEISLRIKQGLILDME